MNATRTNDTYPSVDPKTPRHLDLKKNCKIRRYHIILNHEIIITETCNLCAEFAVFMDLKIKSY
jgi:hypothetical protein